MTDGTHETFMKLALAQAEEARALGEIPVGAVIVKDGAVIAAAGNRRETQKDPTAHAEMLALRMAARKLQDWRMTGCTMYVTLEPCPMCAGALAMARMSGIVFGAWDERMGCCGSRYLLPGDGMMGARPPEIVSGVLAQACREILTRPLRAKREEKEHGT